MWNRITKMVMAAGLLGMFFGESGCSRVDGVENTAPVEDCSDGVDNDDDGAVDCADEDCVLWFHCGDEPADSGTDNGTGGDSDTGAQIDTGSGEGEIDTMDSATVSDSDTVYDPDACGGLIAFEVGLDIENEGGIPVPDECCTVSSAFDECWMENARSDRITCTDNDLNNCAPGFGCTNQGLCACANSCQCNDGYCSTSGFCIPSYCNGYYVCSCFGGCTWWDGASNTNMPAQSAAELGRCCVEPPGSPFNTTMMIFEDCEQ